MLFVYQANEVTGQEASDVSKCFTEERGKELVVIAFRTPPGYQANDQQCYDLMQRLLAELPPGTVQKPT